MSTDALLTLTQWLSPAFPVGAFAYSHGLEQVIDRGDLQDASQLEQWLNDILDYGSGQSDVILLAAAYNATPQELAEVTQTARAFCASSERLTETQDQGAAFARTVDAIWDTEIGPCPYPVAVGRAAAAKNLPLDMTAEVYLHAIVANLVSVAVRLVPLGQTEGQAVLARLGPKIRSNAAAAIFLDLDDLSSACFAADIAAMHHETQYSKVFRT
ncbi:MAG: urease accessory protein UreF [Roseobacter sp.]